MLYSWSNDCRNNVVFGGRNPVIIVETTNSRDSRYAQMFSMRRTNLNGNDF